MPGRTVSLPFCNTRLTPSCLPAAEKKLSSLLFLALPLLLISLSLLLFSSPQFASAQSIITVDDDPGADHVTIQDAINAATTPGDTIQVAAGTYAETLDLQGKTLTIEGAGVDDTIVNASLLTGYAIQNFGNSSAVRGLTLIGTTNDYGFKIAGVSDVTLEDIKVEDSKKTGIDLNGVNGGTLADIEVADTVSGFGINMVDSNDIVLTDITTSGNAWGGVSVQTKGTFFPGGSNNIIFSGFFDASEPVPLLLEQDPPDYPPITNVQIPSQFEYVVFAFREGDDYKQWFYQETLEGAESFAQVLIDHPTLTHSGMLIHDIAEENFHVVEGMLTQDAIDAAQPDGTISIHPGNYIESGVCPFPMCSTPNSGLFINKNGITLQGVDATGDLIDNAEDVQAWIIADEKGEFGFLNPVVADDVTIQGLGFTIGDNTGSFKTIDVMGDSLSFVNNIVDNSGASGTSAIYFSVNPNVLHPNINEEGAVGRVDNFEVTDNIFIAGAVTVAGGVGISHTFTESGTVDDSPTYTIEWSDEVVSGIRIISGNEIMPEDEETQDEGLVVKGYIPSYWGVDIPTVPASAVEVTENTFRAGIDIPVLMEGGQNADNPTTPIMDLAAIVDDNTFEQSVLVTIDEGRTEVRAETQVSPHGSDYPVFAIQSSIQDGVDIAETGDFVWVGQGEYNDNVGISIGELTIQGDGSSTTTIAPSSGRAISLNAHTAGLINNITIRGFTLVPDDGQIAFIAFSGTVVEAPDTTNLTLEDIRVTDATYGIVLNAVENATLTAIVLENIDSPNDVGALELTGVSDLSIQDSTFSDNALAVRLQSTDGLSAVEYGGNGPISIADSSFTGNDLAISNEDPIVIVDAAENYWGSATGPSHAENPAGTGDSISDNVDFKPYYLNAAMTVQFSEDQVVIDDDEPEPVIEVDPETPEVVIPENLTQVTKIDIVVSPNTTDATINVASLITSADDMKNVALPVEININATTEIGEVEVNIPSGANIVADDSWDGTINVPAIKATDSVTVTPSDDDVEVDEVLTVIEIGFEDVALEFDTGVRIVIPDMAGNLAGYSRAGTFTPITDICAADTQEAGDDLPDGGDCKIDVGDDLAIWTKHFTSFVVYNEAPVAPDDDEEDAGSGGGGGGGDRTVVVTWPSVETLQESYFSEFPLARIQVASSVFLNAQGLSIAEARVGEQVSVSAEFTNHQETSQGYAFIVQVLDPAGIATDIMWQESVLGPGQSTDVSVSVALEEQGVHLVKIFVWNGIGISPEPLSEVTVKNISVT